MAIAVAIAACGCGPRKHLKIRYLSGFVPGSQNVFRPARIAIAPTDGSFAAGRVEVGHIYDADGTQQSSLTVSDPRRIVTRAIVTALRDSGLQPVALDAAPGADTSPEGVDFVLKSRLMEFDVEKRFGAEQTVHGQYFTMNASVRIAFELRSRHGNLLYAGELAGIENEPPTTVDREVFLPLETEPAESLSVAMSRAVGSLMLQPDFRRALPTLPSPAPSPASSVAPTPTPVPGVIAPSHH